MTPGAGLRLRRVLSTAVILVAGLASLATSPGAPTARDTVSGQTAIGPDGVELRASVDVRGRRGSSRGENTFQFGLRIGSGEGPSSTATLAQILRADGSDPNAPWSGLPASVPLDVADCAAACSFAFLIRLKTAANSAEPVILPWRASAIVQGEATLTLTIVPPGDAPVFRDAAIPAAAVGFGVGLLAALALASIRHVLGRSRPLSRWLGREALAAFVLIATGVYVALGAASGLATASAGALMVVAGAIQLVSVIAQRAAPSAAASAAAKVLVLLGLLALPFVLSRFSTAGEYRQSDAFIAVAATAFVAGLALWSAAELAWPLLRRLRLVNLRTWTVFGVAVAMLAISYPWTFLIAAGATPLSSMVAVPFGVASVLIVAAVWRWLQGECITPFIVGLAMIIPAGLVVAGALVSSFSLFGDPDRTPAPNLIEWSALLALGGVAFALLTMLPPNVKGAFPPGRPLQTEWAYRSRIIPAPADPDPSAAPSELPT